MALRTFDICIRLRIHLEVQWIPRTSNQQADYISRLILMIGKLQMKLRTCGAHIVQIVLQISITISSTSISRGFGTPIPRVLIFSLFQSLRGENCLVPPVGIIPRVLHYLKSQQAVGTLVVPLWPSSHFWLLIAHQFRHLVALTIHIRNEVLTHGRN